MENILKMLTVNYVLISFLVGIYIAIQILKQETIIEISTYSHHGKIFNSLVGYSYYTFNEPNKNFSKQFKYQKIAMRIW